MHSLRYKYLNAAVTMLLNHKNIDLSHTSKYAPKYKSCTNPYRYPIYPQFADILRFLPQKQNNEDFTEHEKKAL